MYFTVHTDDNDDTDSLIFYNIQADRACGSSPQGQTDHCLFNSWTDRQSQLSIVLFSKFVRT